MGEQQMLEKYIDFPGCINVKVWYTKSRLLCLTNKYLGRILWKLFKWEIPTQYANKAKIPVGAILLRFEIHVDSPGGYV